MPIPPPPYPLSDSADQSFVATTPEQLKQQILRVLQESGLSVLFDRTWRVEVSLTPVRDDSLDFLAQGAE